MVSEAIICVVSCLFYLVPLLNRQGTRGKWQVIPFSFNCNFTGPGHITPAATLGEELVRRGHNATLYTKANYGGE